MELASLTQKLAEIRNKLASLVDKINEAAAGEPFYGRIILEDRHLTGLIENLKMNQYKLIFDFTEEKLINGGVVKKKVSKEIKLEKLRGIDVFKTLSGMPMFVEK